MHEQIINDYYRNICIVGYGNVGKHVAEELKGLEFDIKDINIPEYIQSTNKTYKFAFVCVPTEMNEDGTVDLSCVEDAVANIKAEIIIIKSAIPIGTAEMLKNKYRKNIVVSPEFYGTTQFAISNPNWIILGGNKDHCSKVAQLYYRIKDNSFRIRFTDWKTAELTKYCENTFLAMRVTMFNEFAKIAQTHGINYEELRECLIMDNRIGDSHSFVFSDQPYWDSHCLNKDIVAMILQGNGEAKLVKAMYEINQERKIKIN